jgi:hypothetical protein
VAKGIRIGPPPAIDDADRVASLIYSLRMRTTIRLDEDVAAAAEQLRRERHIGLSQAVNELARIGMQRGRAPRQFRQHTEHLGLRVDVTKVAEALDLLDETNDAR